MKLERVKCKPLERAKNLCVSRSYVVGCTGQKAAILDKQLNLLHTVDKLEYVYCAAVSPDETKLLLISNGNKFYIVDLQTYEKTSVTVKAPYSYNLEGIGCWSFDGRSLWIPVNRSVGYINSTLRRYWLDDLSRYEDRLKDKYVITGLVPVEKTRSYFLTGYNRQENNRCYFIHFDGTGFREFPLAEDVDMLTPAITVDAEKGVVNISDLSGCRQFTPDGKLLASFSHPAPKDKMLCGSALFEDMPAGNGEQQKQLKEFSAALGLEHISAPDRIAKRSVSLCGSYIYLASQSGFYLQDAHTEAVLASVPEEYGVQNVEELAPGLIAIATWTGVKIYRLCED